EAGLRSRTAALPRQCPLTALTRSGRLIVTRSPGPQTWGEQPGFTVHPRHQRAASAPTVASATPVKNKAAERWRRHFQRSGVDIAHPNPRTGSFSPLLRLLPGSRSTVLHWQATSWAPLLGAAASVGSVGVPPRRSTKAGRPPRRR